MSFYACDGIRLSSSAIAGRFVMFHVSRLSPAEEKASLVAYS